MTDLRLSLAVGDYDQTRDLALGRVRPVGIDLTVVNFDVEEIFYRFFDRLEWDVAELSMGMYTSAISRGDKRFIAIPVFPSRYFRHSAIYIRSDGKIRSPQDLAGKRIGIPQWSQTAGIYVRGYLAETVGLSLDSIDWVQGGVNEAGRVEPAVLKLPEGIRITGVGDKSLNDMLIAGEIDAIISARPPSAFTDGDARVALLFPNYKEAEEEYFRKEKIFPIMHTVAIRRDVYEANRWIARNLFLALEEAKNRSVKRILDLTAAHVPLPWAAELADRGGRGLVFKGGEFWPYGIKENRVTLEAFLRFCYDQGTCHRKLSIEEIFAEEALAEIKV